MHAACAFDGSELELLDQKGNVHTKVNRGLFFASGLRVTKLFDGGSGWWGNSAIALNVQSVQSGLRSYFKTRNFSFAHS